MAINLTAKYAEKVDERFAPLSKTGNALNNDYDFMGANVVKVTSINTVAGSDYNRGTGYGAGTVMANAVQTLTMTKDRAFKIVLDKMDEEESKIKAGEVLARQWREVVVPEVEAYRLGKFVAGVEAGNTFVPTAGKAYEDFLKAQALLTDAFVPEDSRVAFTTVAFLNEIKAAKVLSVETLNNGVTAIDGVPVYTVPAAMLGTASLVLTHKSVMVSPVKLEEMKVITDSEQYSGTVFAGRYYYDAFILDSKKNAFVVIKP